jgi:hypothetical protein
VPVLLDIAELDKFVPVDDDFDQFFNYASFLLLEECQLLQGISVGMIKSYQQLKQVASLLLNF